ncbi:MAG: hypothetical protein ACKO22_03610, partial [Cyanobium sp.]
SIKLGGDRRAELNRIIAVDNLAEADEKLKIEFYADPSRALSLGLIEITISDNVISFASTNSASSSKTIIQLMGASDGRDRLIGSDANEIISGVPQGSVLKGRGSIDTLTGGGGDDLFVLGDSNSIYYTDGNSARQGTNDLAIISDFNLGDRIQLKGRAGDYRLTSGSIAGTSGMLLHWRAGAGAGNVDEVIGFVQGMTSTRLSLMNGDQFIYVGQSIL